MKKKQEVKITVSTEIQSIYKHFSSCTFHRRTDTPVPTSFALTATRLAWELLHGWPDLGSVLSMNSWLLGYIVNQLLTQHFVHTAMRNASQTNKQWKHHFNIFLNLFSGFIHCFSNMSYRKSLTCETCFQTRNNPSFCCCVDVFLSALRLTRKSTITDGL